MAAGGDGRLLRVVALVMPEGGEQRLLALLSRQDGKLLFMRICAQEEEEEEE